VESDNLLYDNVLIINMTSILLDIEGNEYEGGCSSTDLAPEELEPQ
jgi:hypothetical protein